MKKVFLGGTCNESKWRELLIPMLKIDYFNPVVEDWTEECQAEEIRQRAKCDFSLYVITPKMAGVYAIAEAVQDSCRRPEKTLFCILPEDDGVEFNVGQLRSFMAVFDLIELNGAQVFGNLRAAGDNSEKNFQAIADYLNQSYVEIPYNPNLIECLIERDGPTEMNLHKATYLFEKNELGDYVCEVLSGDHRKHLLSLKPDFRIYQEEKAPPKDFTDEEDDFIREWKLLSDDVFLAYVNGHIAKFNDSRAKVRVIAAEKWRALLSHMDCPIRVDDEVPEQTNPDPGPSNFEDELTVFDKEFWQGWKNLNGVLFKKYVNENEQQFLDAPEFLWDKAMAKWQKLITDKTGEIWPFEENEGRD
jgi:hypothetical protein